MEVPRANEICNFNGHSDSVYFVQVFPDGKFITSQSLDKTIKVWIIQELREDWNFGKRGSIGLCFDANNH